MKKIISLILLFCAGISYGETARDNRGKWGYIHHKANLDAGYIESIIDSYEVIAITGFTIAGPRKISHDANALYRTVLSAAQKHGTMLYPLISFSSPAAGHNILENGNSRKELADTIVSFAGERGWSGVHLDFEYLPPGDALALSMLLKELKRRSQGLKLTMAVFPQAGFPEKYAGFHDPALLSPHVDEIVLMAYDLHRPGTAPGPVTNLAWAEKNILALLAYYGNDRIWLGVPAYGYSWHGKSAEAVSAKYGEVLAGKFGSRRDASGCLHIRYNAGNKSREAYISDRYMRSQMSGLAARYRLRGTALWRLGFEEEESGGAKKY